MQNCTGNISDVGFQNLNKLYFLSLSFHLEFTIEYYSLRATPRD
jgi:hypothetical protein